MRNLAQLMQGLAGEWPLLLPLLVGGLAVWLLLPRPRPYPWYLGALAGGLSLFLAATLILRTSGVSPEVVLFYAFSGLALVGAGMLVTQHNPARAALSFTLVVLSTCGLFLLLGAPFLMAATIIVYAGAIIVTFLFVLMLAQQAGLSDADARSREPALATFTGFLLLATMLYVLKGYQRPGTVEELLGRTEAALALGSRDEMLPVVEPRQTDEERARNDRRLFKQAESVLNAAGLRDLARSAREAGEEWVVVELNAEAPADEKAKQSRQALEKLQRLLADHRERISERLTEARLPGVDDAEGRRLPAMSSLSGPPPTTPFREVRRDAAGRPELPAENSASLGRALFTEYLLPVEIGGTLLLIATVGAIAIAQRREPGRPA
ncbi:MAG: NADH-quinone oxidoreductase subunit J [Gemmataceae bacterium]